MRQRALLAVVALVTLAGCTPSAPAQPTSPGETPKYEPVLSGPYLMGKFKKTVM